MKQLLLPAVLSMFFFSPQASATSFDCAGLVTTTVKEPGKGKFTGGVEATLKIKTKKSNGVGVLKLDNPFDEPIFGTASKGSPSKTAQGKYIWNVTAPSPMGSESGVNMTGSFMPIEKLHEEDTNEYWVFSIKSPMVTLAGTMTCTSK